MILLLTGSVSTGVSLRADAFEVMTSGRPYKEALSQVEALNELQNNTGKQFDPILVKLLIKTFKEKQAFPTPNIQL